MVYEIIITAKAKKALAQLDAQEARRVTAFLRERVAPAPRSSGGQLKGKFREFWRYRVGSYRILTQIENEKLIVYVVRVGHRSSIYVQH